jgi:glycosyltransferase involved in cell wall biosynthesis
MSTLTAVILTKNEATMIERAIAGVAFADEILVVDGGSTDATVSIASLAGVRVIERPFDDFARQRNFALEQASGDWVLFVDADERPTPELRTEIRALLTGTPDRDAYAIPRVSMVLGRWIDWHPGGSDAPVRLVRRGSARWANEVHETLAGAGPAGTLTAPLVHFTHRSVGEVVRKIDQYADLEAAAAARAGARPPPARTILASFPRALWGLWRSGLRREGTEGAIEAVLLAFNRTLVLAKLWEKTRAQAIEEAYARAEESLARGASVVDLRS